jgi:predicted transcriptional regulator
MPTTETILTPKQDIHRLLESLPDTATWEEIEYAVHVLARVRAGLDDAVAGRIVTSEEARARMKQWLAE